MSETKASIAIIGTGFAGLALGYEWLIATPGATIDFYESTDQRSASQIASGLLHLFHGQQARIPPFARQSLSLTLDLFQAMSQEAPLLKEIEILRPARNEMQSSNFKKRAHQYPDELSFGETQIQNRLVPDVLTIHKAWVADSPAYLNALKTHLKSSGCRFLNEPVSKELLKTYEKVAIAAGANSLELMHSLSGIECPSSLDTITTKGQLAVCSQIIPPQFAINAKAYILPLNENRDTLIGATFERTFTSDQPEASIERTRLWDEATGLWPSLALCVPHWMSALRLSGPEHLPFIGSLDSRLFVISGLGSKGLLYHRLVAQKLSNLMKHSPPSKVWEILPFKVLIDDISY